MKEILIRGFDMFQSFQDPIKVEKCMRIVGNDFMQVENLNVQGKDELFEKLADIEHQRWSDWQKYLHSLCLKQVARTVNAKTGIIEYIETGDLVIPKELVERWERQIATSYAELSEKEKESDREQVKRYWGLINL